MIQQVNPWLDGLEIQNVADTIHNNWITEGPKCAEAIEKLQDLLGLSFVTFAPNGTLGLFIGLLALDLPKGSEVLVPDFTFFGSCSAIVMAGLTPVTVDVDLDTYQIDLDDMKRKLTKNTSAIMPVHVYGQGSNICEIVEFAKKEKLKVIEDAAQVLVVKYSSNAPNSCGSSNCCYNQKRHLGTFGDIGVFSLYADKTITAGEGGIICCRDEEVFERLKLLRNQGRPNSGTFVHPAVGMNFRITDLQGAILSVQLDRLPQVIEQRNSVYEEYKAKLSNLDIKFMSRDQRSEFIPFRTAITVPDPVKTISDLEAKSIQVRRYFYPMCEQPALTDYNLPKCENSLKLYNTGICLPIHREITSEKIEKIFQALQVSCSI